MEIEVKIFVNQAELSEYCEKYYNENGFLPTPKSIKAKFYDNFLVTYNPSSLDLKVRVCHITNNGKEIEF